MYRHYHLRLYVNQARALELADNKVCERCHVFSQRFVEGEPLNKTKSMLLNGLTRLWFNRHDSILVYEEFE